MNNINKIMNFVTKNLILKSRSSKKLYGEDLHKYLLSLVIRYEPPNNFFPKYSKNNFDKLIEFLQEKGKKILKYSTKRFFSDYCHCRYVLNKVFHLYREKLIRKEVSISVSNFVEDNFGISDR